MKFNESDILGLINLSTSVGRDYDKNEIQTVLLSGEIYGHKNEYGEIVSSAAIILYENNLASIGMVIVHEDFRGLGLAKEATKKCIDTVPKKTQIMLISTEEGKPLYKKLGFITIDNVHKYLSDQFLSVQLKKHVVIEDYIEQDLDDVIQLDSAAFGGRRTNLLSNRIKQSKSCLVAKNNKGKIIGFGLSIIGSANLLIGPVVAKDSRTAIELIHELIQNYSGKLRIDVPGDINVEIEEFLTKLGFKQVNTPPIMVRNSDHLPKRNNQLYAIAAQVFG
ncbi:GNAT family N-acetyltransferase [Alkalihalobacillus pseudalcaliphilus]|uniref:GNAT family N-acetyltransferase n=1 Tax=Alkalihalobacillus pseudalcaliphilus TaxID=79884 RepID=UPI00064D8783|nr:GNAT family N-acetyltransferase [Alkalihalobacillus pseudalcaliphilus]KMK77516.1 acetyltransferase [Alkalihalobacillus pseudalcaliphilus]